MVDVLGKVVEWNNAKGFGFIQPYDGTLYLFLQADDFDGGDNGWPQVGDWVRFEHHHDGNGRVTAVKARPVVPRRAPTAVRMRRRHQPGQLLPLLGWLFLFGCAAGAASLLHSGRLLRGIALSVGVLSLLTWIAYALDRHAAERLRPRIPESTLHLLELFGGWPGGFLAQRMLHHKRCKLRYQLVFWLLALVHTAAVSAWALGLLRLP